MSRQVLSFQDFQFSPIEERGSSEVEAISKNDIAIIGISVLTPKAANKDQFWNNLINGVNTLGELSENRKKDIERYLHYKGDNLEKINYLNAAYLEEIDKFDFKFFKLSPKEASLMNPIQRMFLESTWKAIEDAGYGGKKLKSSNTGVYAGLISDLEGYKYKEMILETEPPSFFEIAMAGNLSSIIPSRISYILDLKGPSILVDTACSSSLVAVYLACKALRNGDCDQALVGAVRLNILPIDNQFKLGMESSDGITRAFDDSSDGTGRGEGAAAVMLKPLNKALLDRDNIYAVIKGCAVNQDGNSMGITAPNSKAQSNVLIKAWQDAGIDPETISYIETHGTGTKLGDPIEIDGIEKAFGRYTGKKQFCAIGSVKNNLGHLYEAAGIMSLAKVILALKNKTIPPTINFQRPNQRINFTDSPVYVNDRLSKWEAKGFPRRAGVSSFGFSGTNCHIVVEEFSKEANQEIEPANGQIHIFTLSALEKETLQQLIKDYCEFFNRKTAASLRDICYTANTGRGHYTHRLAFIVKDIDDLKMKLAGLAQKQMNIQTSTEIFYGECKLITSQKTTKENGEITEEERQELTRLSNIKLEAFIRAESDTNKILPEICDLYVKGAEIEWESLYANTLTNKISLPGYPFKRSRCWLDIPEAASLNKKTLFHTVQWIQYDLLEGSALGDGPVIIFNHGSIPGKEIAQRMRNEGRRVIEVGLGKLFEQINESNYIISNCAEDYLRLLHQVKELKPVQIIHMNTLNQETVITSSKELEAKLRLGVYSLFYLSNALCESDYSEELDIVLLSEYVNDVTGDEVELYPENATLFGLGKSLRLENRLFNYRAIDIDRFTSLELIMKEIKTKGQVYQIAYRKEKRYAEILKAVNTDDKVPLEPKVKQNGVYIIIGGTGGIGLEIAKSMAEKKIHIILASRTQFPPEEEWGEILRINHQSKLCNQIKAFKEIKETGSSLSIYSVDITDYSKMKTFIDTVRNQFSRIDGVIHSAGISAVNNKTEKDLSEVLDSKVTGTWILDQVTQTDNLDFLVMFSSAVSLWGAPRQGDYVAANSFLDAFAAVRNRRGKRSQVINWVVWKETGMAYDYGFNIDTELFKTISTSEAVRAFNYALLCDEKRFLIGELNYDLQGTPLDLAKRILGDHSSPVMEKIKRVLERENTGKIQVLEEGLSDIENFGRLLLLDAFQHMGVFKRKNETHLISDLRSELKIIPNYTRLLNALLDILVKGGFIVIDEQQITTTERVSAPETKKSIQDITTFKKKMVEKIPDKEPYFTLLEVCLQRYPEILTGKISATFVMFPDYSMDLVENIYRGNKLANFFNECAAKCIREHIEIKRTSAMDDYKIVEIGAGTGGTTVFVLDKIKDISEKVTYFYTDVSIGFTDYGKENLGSKYPFVKFKELNIEKDVQAQGFEVGEYDVVLASNVLHATCAIESTLKQVKRLLKPNGLLILNEVTKVQDFATLTFGLLDGWWLYKDEELRLKNSPLLSKDLWEKLLRINGFDNTYILGGKGAEGVSQSLILAQREEFKELSPRRSTIETVPERISKFSQVRLKGRKDGLYSPNELMIGEIWSEVLGLEEVDIYENFYDIGGDSILATKILNRINQKISNGLNITEALQYLSVAEMASALDRKNKNVNTGELKTANPLPDIEPAGKREWYPASSGEKRLYILEQLGNAGTSYNIPIVMKGRGEFKPEKIESIFRKMIQRHDTLRTSFRFAEEDVIQIVHEDEEVDFHVEYGEIGDKEISDILEDFIQPFDLNKVPLFKVKFLKISQNEFILMIDIHHIICDGVSIGILIKEFLHLYKGETLPKLDYQYKDFTVWQNKLYETEMMKRQEEFWLDLFHGQIPTLNIPTDFPRPSLQSFEGDRITFELGRDLTTDLIKLASENNTTLFMVLFAAYNILLSKYANQEDIIVGTIIAGRPRIELENLIGMFVNTLAMRNYPCGRKTFREFLGDVRQNSLKAYENQDYPFERLVEKFNLQRDMSRPPLFNTVFNMKITDVQVLEMDDLALTPVEFIHKVSKFDFLLEVAETNQGLRCYLEYCIQLFRRETMERFGSDYHSILRIISTNPDILIKDINFGRQYRRQDRVLKEELQFNF